MFNCLLASNKAIATLTDKFKLRIWDVPWELRLQYFDLRLLEVAQKLHCQTANNRLR